MKVPQQDYMEEQVMQLFPQLEACGRHYFHLMAVSFSNAIFIASLLARGIALLFQTMKV